MVAWLPSIISGYKTIADAYPILAYGYLGVVSLGAVVMLGISGTVFVRVWRNTRRRGHQPRTPAA